MAEVLVDRILVTLWTGNREGADTKGDVFLGLGGREFNLRLPNNQNERQRGAKDEYSLGRAANIANKTDNDPRTGLEIKSEQLGWWPPFIRFKGQTDDDTWNLEAVTVEVTSRDGIQRWARMAGNDNHLWLGNKSGNICYLEQRQ